MISILIPAFNDDCTELAAGLARQAEAIGGLQWELLVGDDASTDAGVVARLESIGRRAHCRYIRQEQNAGRAAIRNRLAREARGEWLLYVDADLVVVDDNHLRKLVEAGRHAAACYGGYRVLPGPAGNLRHRYERAAAPVHTAARRRRTPYLDFKVSNSLIRRDVMLRHPLDERFRKYGYEDVLLGKQLQTAGVGVAHIDAPVGFARYEDNARFVRKTEEGIETLHRFRADLDGFSPLLQMAETLRRMRLAGPFLFVYRLLGQRWRRNLVSEAPSLRLFKCYKLGYLLRLMAAAED